MKPGKLPPALLSRLLARVPPGEGVVIGPRYGEDAAVVEPTPGRLLVAKTDPITFAADAIGWYAVQVNGNDLAAMGARARWFLASVLLPAEAGEELAEAIFAQVLSACHEAGIALVGGHTEITLGLERPIVVGCLLGEVDPARVITSGGAQPGDVILVTKALAVEGTALLAREVPAALLAAGIPRETITRAADLLYDPGISIAREARALCDTVTVHALHDPTEGGLATGLAELAAASGVGLRLEQASIPVLPETEQFCRALGLDPLGLIASGTLIAALPPFEADHARAVLHTLGIPAAIIGTATDPEQGLVLVAPDGSESPLPVFPRDELARYWEGEEQACDGG